MSVQIPLLCFNDVYRVKQRFVPQPGSPEATFKDGAEIGVTQFGQLLFDERDKWSDRKGKKPDRGQGEGSDIVEGDVEKEGLVLFAGDVFNPSVESSVTRGSHMVPILNALKIDCACIGNHDFDFGYPHLTKLLSSTTFPWLLSNIIDKNTGKTPKPLKPYFVTERCGVKIGIIGLVEPDWIATIPSWPENFEYQPMKETALDLSKKLRDPKGEHQVQIVIALTHCRVPNDIKLANDLGAVDRAEEWQDKHGVDLLIGGHDHIYYIGEGAREWDGYSGKRDAPGTEHDKGVRLIKSGTDFRDLSSATLTLSEPSSSTRRRIVTSLTGKHHYILPSSPSSHPLESLLKSLLSSVSDTLSKNVCYTLTTFDARSEVVRTQETGLGNWIADVLLHAYAESLMEMRKGENGRVKFEKDNAKDLANDQKSAAADGVIICGGSLRGDSQYGPGKITLGDILEILPFEDAVVCLEIDGKGIWDAIESGLSKWPAQEGRFPIVAGLAVQWDHTAAPMQRVKSIHLVIPPNEGEHDPEDWVEFADQEDGTKVEIKRRKLKLGEEIKNESGGRMYRIITREYMAEGYDGFEALKNRKFIVDDESGQIMSSIIRSFLLGSAYIWRHHQIQSVREKYLSPHTSKAMDRARAEHIISPSQSPYNSPALSKTSAMTSPMTEKYEPMSPISDISTSSIATNGSDSFRHHVIPHGWASIRDALLVAKHEHMSDVDGCHGDEMRRSHSGKKRAGRAIQSVNPMTPTKNTHETEEANTIERPAVEHFVNKAEREEIKALSNDLAFVCPLIDGRMKDLGVDEKR